MKEWIMQKRHRIIISGMLMTSIPVIVLSLVVYFTIADHLEELIIKENKTLINISASRIEMGLNSAISVGNVFARRPMLQQAVRRNDRNAMRWHLRSLIENYDRIEQAFITTPAGVLIAGYPDDSISLGKDFSSRDWYKGVSQNWTPYVSEYYKRQIKPIRHVFAITVPIRDEQQDVIGILAMQPHADFIKRFLDVVHIGAGKAYVTDRNGNLIYHSDFLPDELIGKTGDPAVSAVMHGAEGIRKFTDPSDGSESIYAYRPISGTGWGVVIKRPISDVFGPLNRIVALLFGVTALMLIVGGSMSYHGAQQLFLVQNLSNELKEEEEVEKAYSDLLGLLNRQWFNEGEMADALLRKLREHVCIEAGVLSLIDDEKAVPCGALNVPMPKQADGFVEECLKQRRLLRIRKVPQDSYLLIESSVAGTLVPKDIIAMPLILQENVVGVLEIACVHGFSARQEKIIDRIGPQLASSLHAIADARTLRKMSEELASSNEELRVANEELQVVNEEMQIQQSELTEANKRLDSASRAKSDFLSNMSHELRTPLNSIIGFSDLLSDQLFGSLNEQQKEYVDMIVSSGRHLLSLINDILDLAKIEAGKEELVLEPVGINKILTDALTLLREKAMKHGVRIDLVLETPDDLIADADKRKLKQILLNLLSNAVKFTENGGAVTLYSRKTGHDEVIMRFPELAGSDLDYVEIAVVDTGIGIRSEDIPKLFNEFSQIESPYEKKYEGTGLGLVLSARYVEKHNGRIWVESTFGKGSRFAFILPLRQSFGEKPEIATARDFITSTARRTALIIEDDPKSVAIISEVLAEADYSVVTATEGESGLQMALTMRPNLIILDLMLPGIDGFEVLKAIRDDEKISSVAVIIITSMELSQSQKNSLGERVLYVLEKGRFTKEQFIDRVRRVCC